MSDDEKEEIHEKLSKKEEGKSEKEVDEDAESEEEDVKGINVQTANSVLQILVWDQFFTLNILI